MPVQVGDAVGQQLVGRDLARSSSTSVASGMPAEAGLRDDRRGPARPIDQRHTGIGGHQNPARGAPRVRDADLATGDPHRIAVARPPWWSARSVNGAPGSVSAAVSTARWPTSASTRRPARPTATRAAAAHRSRGSAVPAPAPASAASSVSRAETSSKPMPSPPKRSGTGRASRPASIRLGHSAISAAPTHVPAGLPRPRLRRPALVAGEVHVQSSLVRVLDSAVRSRGRPRIRSAATVNRICSVPPAIDRHRVSRNSFTSIAVQRTRPGRPVRARIPPPPAGAGHRPVCGRPLWAPASTPATVAHRGSLFQQ